MGPTWGPSGADKTQVGPILAPWTLLSGVLRRFYNEARLYFAIIWKSDERNTPFTNYETRVLWVFTLNDFC